MFCIKCGKENSNTNQFCSECGESFKKTVHDTTSRMEQEEMYLGGTASLHLRKGKLGTMGYGVYATNKRIFGCRNSSIIAKSYGALFLGGVIAHTILDTTSQVFKDDSKKNIEELERNKDFEAKKEDIVLIEWKKVSLWDGGRLSIKTKSKEEFIIGGDGKQEFEYLLSLMQTFYPEVLKIK